MLLEEIFQNGMDGGADTGTDGWDGAGDSAGDTTAWVWTSGRDFSFDDKINSGGRLAGAASCGGCSATGSDAGCVAGDASSCAGRSRANTSCSLGVRDVGTRSSGADSGFDSLAVVSAGSSLDAAGNNGVRPAAGTAGGFAGGATGGVYGILAFAQ